MIRKKKVFVDSSFWVSLLDKKSADYARSREKYKTLVEENVIFYSSNMSVSKAIAFFANRVSEKVAMEFHSFLIHSEATGRIKLIGYNKKYFRDTIEFYLEHYGIFGEEFLLPLNLTICRNKKIQYLLTVEENKDKLANFNWIQFI